MNDIDSIELCFYPKKIPSFKDALLGLCAPSKNKLRTYDLHHESILKQTVDGESYRLPLNLVYGCHIKLGEKCELKIIIENTDLIAFHKPPKLHSHPLSYNETDNCLSHLFHYRSEFYELFQKVNAGQFDRGLLYRLDFETSGLMIFIKDPVEYEFLRSNFHHIMKQKIYMARVHGNTKEQETLRHCLVPEGKNQAKMKVIKTSGELSDAILQYEKINYDPQNHTTLLKVFLETGIRHQIRAQLSSIGHPIVGDSLYGKDKDISVTLLLEANQYEWISSQGQKICLKNPFSSLSHN